MYDSDRLQSSGKKLFWKYLENIQEHICIELEVSLSYKFRKTKDWLNHVTIKIRYRKTSKGSQAYISGESSVSIKIKHIEVTKVERKWKDPNLFI